MPRASHKTTPPFSPQQASPHLSCPLCSAYLRWYVNRLPQINTWHQSQGIPEQEETVLCIKSHLKKIQSFNTKRTVTTTRRNKKEKHHLQSFLVDSNSRFGFRKSTIRSGPPEFVLPFLSCDETKLGCSSLLSTPKVYCAFTGWWHTHANKFSWLRRIYYKCQSRHK